jgi:hypothetical protein
VPDAHGPGGDEQRQRGVQHAPGDIAGDHQLLARQPVGDHPAQQHERDQRQRVRPENHAHVARVAGQPRHVQADRHQDQRIADDAGGLAQPQQAELARAQDGEHDSTLASVASRLRSCRLGA